MNKKINKKKRVIIVVVLIVTIFCFHNYRIVNDPLQMPDIVFLSVVDYTELMGEPTYSMSFCDKNGVHYTSNDSLGFDFEKLVEDYRDGNLNNQITYHMTCDVNELYNNYKKLCSVSENKELRIIYPEESPAVDAIKTTWYGLYYDLFGNVKSIVLHEEDAGGSHYTNSKTANEIYNWYMGTFQKQ